MKLEEIERLVDQLEPRDQLRLAAGICKQFSREPAKSETEEARRVRRLAAIARCDALAGGAEGEFDSASDLRRLRNQRIADIS